MKLHHHAKTDSLHAGSQPKPGAKIRDRTTRSNVDPRTVRFDIDDPSRHLGLSTLETAALPLIATARTET
jgi:hypothetical protein